jgi:4-hydroxy-3-methylbut-2-enyl diphosphate reductase
MKEVLRASKAGFCMGVDLALRKLDRVLSTKGGMEEICTLGPIIHNPQVLAEYAAKGVQQVERSGDVPQDSRVVIRAHGVPRDIQEDLQSRGVEIVDATCPKVKKAQLLIAEQTASGRRLLLLGERHHPEVDGLLSYALHNPIVFERLEELRQIELDPEVPSFLAAQTTQSRSEFNAVVAYVQSRLGQDVPVFDTICDTTRERQEEALNIARQVEVVVVVGGYNSGNTRRLVQVVQTQGVESVHVEHEDELPVELLRHKTCIGLTAGASTPKERIDQVQQILENLDNGPAIRRK